MASKLCSRSKSSARVCEDEGSDGEAFDKKSKIPKIPRKSTRLEGRGRSSKIRKSNSRCQNFTTSMIPRPEWKKCYKKSLTSDNSKTKLKKKSEETQQQQQQQQQQQKQESQQEQEPQQEQPQQQQQEEEEEEVDEKQETVVEEVDTKLASESCPLETKINKDLANFKDNVLKVPEFWSDAGKTVTNVLKNAVNIVSKQYPSADVDTFEQEIQNILKATEVVKGKITTKTENIISDVDKIYAQEEDLEEDLTSEEAKPSATKVDEVKDESKKISGDIKEINELEKAIKSKKEGAKSPKKGPQEHEEEGKSPRHRATKKKSKLKLDGGGETRMKGLEKNINQSCGDSIRSEKKVSTPRTHSSGNSIRSVEEKSCQTALKWSTEMKKEEILAGLNNKILELHQLCQDHISKFKSFNLQIKLRGICNKAQNSSVSKEIQILNEEKYKLEEKNSKLHFYNRDLETAIKQKDQDLHQKDRLISQQKKLLNVRDELIEMLKNKCKIEDVDKV